MTLTGCEPEGNEHAIGTPPAGLYARYCSDCHGADGKGIFLKGSSNLHGSRLSRDQITALILRGDHARHRMPHFPRMTESDARGLSDYVWRLSAGGPGP